MRDDIEMMRRPLNWPRWPVLPLKRRKDGDMECGVLFSASAAPGAKPAVYKVGLHRIDGKAGETWGEVLGRYEKYEYDNLQAVISDGWEVD